MNLKSLCLHGPFFMEGVNYGDKPGTKDTKTAKPLTLIKRDDLGGILAIDGRGNASVIPISSVGSWTPANSADIGIEPKKIEKPAVKVAIQPTEVVRAQHLNPMVGPAPTPRNPAQVENPTQPKSGRAKNT